MPEVIDAKIKRLINLLGTDEGFYILALHSFVEYYLREVKEFGAELSFGQLTWKFREQLLDEYGDKFIDGLSSLAQLGKQHHLTNMVRHSFTEIDPEEARAATSMFLRFCRLAGVSSAVQLQMFNKQLENWESKEPGVQKNIIISSLQNELNELKKKNLSLHSRLETYIDIRDQLEMLKHELSAKELELEGIKKTAGSKDSKTDELRRERFALKEHINRLMSEREDYLELQDYLNYMGRLTVYTRSRLDYERLIAQLSPEQKKIVDTVNFDRDFLVRGSAGTGKSLVLISGMQRLLAQGRLGFFEQNPIIFITYTKTLVKYSRFTAELMKMKIPPVLFSTVDTLVFEKLKLIDDDFVYDFNITDNFIGTIAVPDYIGPAELAAEIDEFLIGRLITKDEYTNKMIQRDGLAGSFDRTQRSEIWDINQRYMAFMDTECRYSVNYGRMRLYNLMKQDKSSGRIKGLQTVFIDEVQDLNPAALAAVKSITHGPLIMAGDFQQSLYMTQHPFVRAGIDIRGTTRILKTNFRNTRQIIETAEAFLSRSGVTEKSRALSFREGPPTELFLESDISSLESALLSRLKLFTEELGYDNENICILAPRNSYVGAFEEILTENEIPSVKINSDEFDFVNRGSVNISTLHSCKGLDFPVVLMYLPELTRLEKYSEHQAEQLLRNLIYTGMTRAMDHLNIFTIESDDPVLRDLIEVML